MYQEENTTNEEPKLVINNITSNIDDSDINEINDNIKIIANNSKLIDIYDVSLIKNGQAVQPNGTLEIRILMTEEQKEYNNLQVIFIDDNNNITVLPHTIEGNYIVFNVNQLSHYAIIGEKKEINIPVENQKDILNQKENNRLLIICGISLLIIILIWIFRRKNK